MSSIPPVGPPSIPSTPPSPPTTSVYTAPITTANADFFSPLRTVGSDISASEVLLRGTPMSLMEFVTIIGENSQGFKHEENLSDLLDSFLQKLLKGNGALTADILNDLLAQVSDVATQQAFLSFSQNSQVTQINMAIAAYNVGILAEIAAVDTLNQAISEYNNPLSSNYGNEVYLDGAVADYNSYVASRSADIIAYNNAIDVYNNQAAINNAAIDQLNDQRTAAGLPALPYEATLTYRAAMAPPPPKSAGHYASPGNVTPLVSRDPSPGGNHELNSVDTVAVQITSAIIAQLYDPIANPSFQRLDELTLRLRYSDEYLDLLNKKLKPTLVESKDQIDETESSPASSDQGSQGGGGILTIGSSLSNPNLERVISSQIFSAATIGGELSDDIFNKVDLLAKFLLTGTALQAATGPALANLSGRLGRTSLTDEAIDVVLAEAVLQSVGALISSEAVKANVILLLSTDPSFQQFTPEQQVATVNSLTAAVNLSLLSLSFNQLGIALGVPGLAGQIFGNAFEGAIGVSATATETSPSAETLPPLDLTQIADPLLLTLLGNGIDPAVAALIVSQLLALIAANPQLAGATVLSVDVFNELNASLSLVLQANGISPQQIAIPPVESAPVPVTAAPVSLFGSENTPPNAPGTVVSVSATISEPVSAPVNIASVSATISEPVSAPVNIASISVLPFSQTPSFQQANALSGTVLLNVLGTTALTSPEAAVRQGISKMLMRALFLPRDTALMISAGVPANWLLPVGDLEAAVARGTVTVVGTSVTASQAIASAGAAVGVALRTPGALDSQGAFNQALASALSTALGISTLQANQIAASVQLQDYIDRSQLIDSLRKEFVQNGASEEQAQVMADVASRNLIAEARQEVVALDAQLQSDILRGNVITSGIERDSILDNQLRYDAIAAAEADRRRMAVTEEVLVSPLPVQEETGEVAVPLNVIPPTSPLIDLTKNELLKLDALANQLSSIIFTQLAPALGDSKALLIAQAFIASLYGREARIKNEIENPVSILNLTIDQIRTLVRREDVNEYKTFIEDRLHDFIKENTMMDYGAYLKARLFNINGRTFLDTINEAMGSSSGVDNGIAKNTTDLLV